MEGGIAVVPALAQRIAKGPLEPVDLPDFGPAPAGMIDVDVLCCSVCHSDVHLLDGAWGEVERPLVPGHETDDLVDSRGALPKRARDREPGLPPRSPEEDHRQRIRSPATMRRMLAFAAAHRVAPIVERMALSAANDAIDRVRSGAARMRIVLSVTS